MNSNKNLSSLTAKMIRAIGDRIAPKERTKGRLCVLNYHRVLQNYDPFLASEPDLMTFRRQMNVLTECFNVMPLREAIITLRTECMPPRAVSITFDDGYRSTHDLALPVLSELSLPATVFVSSGSVSKSDMWNDRILRAILSIQIKSLDLRNIGLGSYSLGNQGDRRDTINRLTEIVKYKEPDVRLVIIKKLEKIARIDPGTDLMVTPAMLIDFCKNNIDVGAHTISHPILTTLSDNDAWKEINDGKQELEKIINKKVELFAYPNGKVNKDFSERHIQMVKEAGFSAAFTTEIGAATSNHDPYQMPRSRPWDTTQSGFAFRIIRWLNG